MQIYAVKIYMDMTFGYKNMTVYKESFKLRKKKHCMGEVLKVDYA